MAADMCGDAVMAGPVVSQHDLANAEPEARSLLLVGYGNTSRRDDGVAAYILRCLLSRLGMDADSIDAEDSLEPGPGIKALFLHQLAPELADLVSQYDTVVFVDAHVEGSGWDDVCWQPIAPSVEAGMIGHHLKPGVVVALAQSLYGSTPKAYMLSVLGHDFDFGETLSPQTSELAEQAVYRLEELIKAQGLGDAGECQDTEISLL